MRHEQGGAYMADMYGRLTRSAGVCLGTLGPGATNLVTGVADAFLDRSPMVVLTGQGDLERMHKESHQYIDVVSMLRPITKFNTRLNSGARDPRGRAQGVQGRRGAEAGADAHRAARGRDGRGRRRRAAARSQRVRRRPEPSGDELRAAIAVIAGAEHPIVLAGNGVARTGSRAGAARFRARRPASASPRRSWARACSTTRTRTRSGPSACSRATTRSPASTTPTS